MIFPKMMAAGKAETVDFKRKEVPEMLREKIRKKLRPTYFNRANKSDLSFIPRKHCQSAKAGILTFTVFAVLPIFWTVDISGKSFLVITVARQSVILTRFPILPIVMRHLSDLIHIL